MDEFAILLIVLAVGFVLSGPVALIISIIALNKTKELLLQIQKKGLSITEPRMTKSVEKLKPEEVAMAPPPNRDQLEAKEEIPLLQLTKLPEIKKESVGISQTGTLEQRIGTRWVLIAGIITVIVGVGFFLKYAYDNSIVGPLGRVVIVSISGLITLCIGEITRKRGYGIVAKAVTALGFAILYAAVFSAYRFYSLIDSVPALILAILITLAAMLYAVSLNEILIAVLSLIGGFLTPVIISTGENVPVPLFAYVLVLGIGAMLCAYYRKWRAVNIVAFVGTFVLYTCWFEKFFHPAMRRAEEVPVQMSIALGWLGVFFAIYLLLPLFNGLVRKIKVQKEDVLLVLTNAAVTFFYLWTILFAKYRMELAFCAIGLCIAHLVIMSIVMKRCEQDMNLRVVLLVIGLFFLTIAVPLYLKMYAVAMVWAIEAVVLLVIGLRYRSIWTQICSAAAILLSLEQLINELPMHTGAFSLILNPAFGTWVFVSAAIAICHILYRRSLEIEAQCRDIVSQVFYSASTLVLMFAFMMEWYWHCDYNIAQKAMIDTYYVGGMIVIYTIITLLLVIRPICPAGRFCKILATVVGLAGACFTMAYFTESYNDSFMIFANTNFAFAILFVAVLFTSAWFLRKAVQEEDRGGVVFYRIFALAAIFVLWVLLTEQIYLYWYCKNRFAEKIANWMFLANMYISVMWAIYGVTLMTAGFWRKTAVLRYISLGLFGLLLGKVFILDMSTVKSVFRIAAFLATGITLVGVSYLYQHLKNKGFFEVALAEGKIDD
ncbi:MAG: DUF2339 domain-containing protein [Planctomycetes bacterium]|nr:DUF2339 domain-containing protein [Planctomycetota bacterium]